MKKFFIMLLFLTTTIGSSTHNTSHKQTPTMTILKSHSSEILTYFEGELVSTKTNISTLGKQFKLSQVSYNTFNIVQ